MFTVRLEFDVDVDTPEQARSWAKEMVTQIHDEVGGQDIRIGTITDENGEPVA